MATIMEHYANLHLHSTHSDGRYTPVELVHLAKELGFGALALTDHDTITGNPIAIEEAKKIGLECIHGAEFCAKLKETGHVMHFAAFGFDPEHPAIKEHIWKMSQRYGGFTMDLFNRAVELGGIKGITWDDVVEYNYPVTWLCTSHVVKAMIAKGVLTEQDKGKLVEEYFNNDLKRTATTARYPFPDAAEFISHVHDAGGIILAAHPHERLVDVEIMLQYGVDGLEVWHSELPAWERRMALQMAYDHDLYVSGGEDHSGLMGGQYYRFEHPEETRYYYPKRTLGTTKYFFEEIRDMKKKPDRKAVMRELLDNDDLWQKTGGITDNVPPPEENQA